MCINIEYTITITNRTFISTIVGIKRIIAKISIRDIELKLYYSNEYAILIFYIKRVLFNNTRTFARITREIYIIDNLKIEILIEANILISKRIIINFAT